MGGRCGSAGRAAARVARAAGSSPWTGPPRRRICYFRLLRMPISSTPQVRRFRMVELDGAVATVELELYGAVAVVTINRPHTRNAISLDTMGELEKTLDAAQGARALVITGA